MALLGTIGHVADGDGALRGLAPRRIVCLGVDSGGRLVSHASEVESSFASVELGGHWGGGDCRLGASLEPSCPALCRRGFGHDHDGKAG